MVHGRHRDPFEAIGTREIGVVILEPVPSSRRREDLSSFRLKTIRPSGHVRHPPCHCRTRPGERVWRRSRNRRRCYSATRFGNSSKVHSSPYLQLTRRDIRSVRDGAMRLDTSSSLRSWPQPKVAGHFIRVHSILGRIFVITQLLALISLRHGTVSSQLPRRVRILRD